MTIRQKTRVLCIGHPYVLAINRAVERELARDPAFEVTVAAPKTFHGDLRPLTLEPEPPDSALRVVGLESYLSRFIHVFRFSSPALRELLRGQAFDIIYAWSEPYTYAGWQVARAVSASKHGKFYFRTAQNLDKAYPPPFGFFEKQCVARAAGWLACGQLVFDTMVQRGYVSDKGRMIPLAVDTTAFKPPSQSAKDDVRKELGLETLVIGYLGRLVPAKGLAVLRRALEKLPPEQPWSLLCLGSGPEEAAISEWAQERGWQDRVQVKLVEHHEVPRYLSAIDVLVAPSQTTPKWKEQFGRMIVEAFASGVPVIGSDSGEIPYVIESAGLIAPEAEVDVWAAAISVLLSNPDQREKFRLLGIERALRYSSVSIASEYRDFWNHDLYGSEQTNQPCQDS